jgi:hypothetical protein
MIHQQKKINRIEPYLSSKKLKRLRQKTEASGTITSERSSKTPQTAMKNPIRVDF